MTDVLLIPACPEVLLELNSEMQKEEPDLQMVSELVNNDVGLYSSLLATVNNPVLGLGQQVESVQQAIMLLGFKRTFTLLESVILRSTLEKHGRLDRFWDTATEVAVLCARIAAEVTTINRDKAYSVGMLHDVGIPVMMGDFPNYKDFLRDSKAFDLRQLATQEVEHFAVDHFALGYRLTKEWNLPTSVCKTILLQPLFEKAFRHSINVHENLLSYLATLMLAKDISGEYRHFWRLTSPDHFPEYLLPVIEFLDMEKMEYLDLKEKLIDELEGD